MDCRVSVDAVALALLPRRASLAGPLVRGAIESSDRQAAIGWIDCADVERFGSNVGFDTPWQEAALACMRAGSLSEVSVADVQAGLLLRVNEARKRGVTDDPLARLARHRSPGARLVRQSDVPPEVASATPQTGKAPWRPCAAPPQRTTPTPDLVDSRKESAPCPAFAPSAI